jgi:hypothetical protein
MGSLRSGRHPYYGGLLKQVGLKFPVLSEWYLLARRIAKRKDISFNEYVRRLVYEDVQRYKRDKMWSCECTNAKGKRTIWFKSTHYCNSCGEYQTEHHKSLYNR